jgi:hypothetical protein
MAIKLEDIHTCFSNNTSDVADEEARLLMKNLRVSQNAESAILDYMAALAHICSYKPHMFEELFAYPADAFVCMGMGNHADAQYYIDYLLADQKNIKYRPLSGEANAWLREQWPSFKNAVDAVLGHELRKALESGLTATEQSVAADRLQLRSFLTRFQRGLNSVVVLRRAAL